MTLIHTAIDLFLHLDKHLNDFASAHPTGVYAILAAIVFCETGFVVTPFLPGDSLLFAVGALAASTGSPINLPLVIVMLCLCANAGDLINYSIGRRVGPAIFSKEGGSILLSRKHLAEAHAFYERHGRKTIILARFVPIIRTFAPFVAGIGAMPFARFIGFSIGGGILWVVSVSLAGYFFGQIEIVKKHFELVVLAIIGISVVPVIVQALRSRGKTQSFEVVART
ncbi:MAG TPA: VTT domain-containing protein [Tepidisphaeraceae bacterium]|nr:VTT domain-containing protein [Tepidisphaeraceae bacterium]